MPNYDFTATPLENLKIGIGSEDNAILGKEFSNFNKTREFSSFDVLKVYQENTDKCVNKAKLDAALSALETGSQALSYDDFGRAVASAGNSLQQTGFGTGKTRRTQIPIGDMRVQKMSITRESLKQWSLLGSHSGKPDLLRRKIGLAMMDAFISMYNNLLQRVEDDLVAHMVSNTAATGGAGTIYTPNVNIQEIPLAGAPTKYRGIYTEANQNRFLRGSNKTPYLISSLVEFMNFDALEALGTYNSSDQKGTQLDKERFNFRQSESLDSVATAGGYSSTSFLIKEGGVGFTTFVPSMGWGSAIPEFNTGGDKFELLTVGDLSALGIPVAEGIQDIKIGYYSNSSVLDTNGTFGNEESFIDQGINVTMFLQSVILAAPSEVVGDTPIVQYGQLTV